MGQLADEIELVASQLVPLAPAVDPQELLDGPELLQIFGKIIAAVRTLEGIATGADFHLELSAPGPADGNDGDAWLNGVTGDLFKKVAGVWEPRGNLRGPKGDNSTVQGPRGNDSQVPGPRGKNNYELWLEAGNSGSLAAFLAWLQGGTVQPGAEVENGADGSTWHRVTTKPLGALGKNGDFALETITASTYRIHQKLEGAWGLIIDRSAETQGAASNPGNDIIINDWSNQDLQNLYQDANWSLPNNFYTGPALTTPAFHEHIRVPTAGQPGYVYKTVPVPGEAAPAVVRIPLAL